MKSRNKLAFVSLLSLLLNVSCQKNTVTHKEDWHPQINEKLQHLADANILNFGMLVKNDGKYCYVSYEGELRTTESLNHTTAELKAIIEDINTVLKTDFAQTALDLTTSKKITSLDSLDEEGNAYLMKKSQLECIRALSQRQIDKYNSRLSDQRLSSR